MKKLKSALLVLMIATYGVSRNTSRGGFLSKSNNNKQAGYERHVFVCSHYRENSNKSSCASKNSIEVMKALKNIAKKELGSKVRVQKSGCLGYCEKGISCVVYPEGVWYTLEGEENIPEILEHLISGTIAEGLRMKLED